MTETAAFLDATSGQTHPGGAPAPWLANEAVQTVLGIFAQAGHPAFLVGGCVRNALLGMPVSDIDIATDATPETVTALARTAGIRAIPTGIDHGTITLRCLDVPFEVTTFRRDVATDGRRATVAYATDIAEDAARRDFTMNALYADAAGTIFDPLGTGLADLRARTVRFIGDPDQRIAEDYLRILRFFRFTAVYGDPAQGIDAEGLAACAAGLDGLENVSRERITMELRKLLAADDPAPALAAMRASGVLMRILPGAVTGLMAVLVHVEQAAGLPPDTIRRMAALGDIEAPSALRLARQEIARLDRLRDGLQCTTPPAALGYRLGAVDAADILALRAATFECEIAPDDLEAARFGAEQSLPVAASDLTPELTGPALGARLKEIEDRWIATGFTLNKADLIGG